MDGAHPFSLTAPTTNIVVEGDSSVWNPAVGTNPGPSSQPAQIRVRLDDLVAMHVVATPGETINQVIAEAATEVDPLYDAAYARNIVLLSIGSNDLAAGDTAASVIADVSSYIAARRAVGWTVVLINIFPRSNAGLDANFETSRQTYNTATRAGGFADALIDVGADTTIGEVGDSDNTTYYSTDKIHPNFAGREIVAGLAKTVLNSLGVL